ncbi:MAG: DUF924 family protein [Cyanobacteria bacterium P01_G01_bin.54]
MIHPAARLVLDFWFGVPSDPTYGQERREWFRKDGQFDAEIRARFLALHQRAAQERLGDWQAEPLSCLALVILLDQLSRNLFRGTPEAFAQDAQALAIAQAAIQQGFDQQVLPVQRWFYYLPLEHSETLSDQAQAVQLFAQLVAQLPANPASERTLDYARKHQAVIQRFGRFPHRNAILGRESTPEEVAFLQQPGSSF